MRQDMSFQQPPSNRKAFSLLEALVVVGVAVILLSLSIPAIRGAIASAQKAQVLSNLKQLYTVVSTQSTDGNNLWPSTNTFGDWVTKLPPNISTNDIKAIFGGAGIKVNSFPPEKSSLTIYQVWQFSSDDFIFGSSANWNASAPAVLDPQNPPFGEQGFIYITRGGRAVSAGQEDSLSSTIPGQPAPLSGIPAP